MRTGWSRTQVRQRYNDAFFKSHISFFNKANVPLSMVNIDLIEKLDVRLKNASIIFTTVIESDQRGEAETFVVWQGNIIYRI